MKVGTDGVLLGAWASVQPSDRRILDIGTGTGLIALMMAQRAAQAHVTGIDVEEVAEARANADASPWGARIRIERTAVQQFGPQERFDLIVSNPPFFVDSLTCPDAGRTTARHAVLLPFEALRDAVVRLLAPQGRFAVILPVDGAAHFVELCHGLLRPVRRTDVRTTPRRPVKRVLLEFVAEKAGPPLPEVCNRCAGFLASDTAGVSSLQAVSDAAPVSSVEWSELVIGTGVHECYTPEYRALTCDFYLKF